MFWSKSRLTPSEKKQFEQMELQTKKQKSDIDYIAMMTDVDIPDENEEETIDE